MCGSEYTDKMFLFLLMFYFDGFYHKIEVRFLHISLVYIATIFFRIFIINNLVRDDAGCCVHNHEGFDEISRGVSKDVLGVTFSTHVISPAS